LTQSTSLFDALRVFRNDETSWDAEDYNPEYLHSALAAYPDTIDYIKELSEWMNSPFPNVRGFKETALIEKYYWLKRRCISTGYLLLSGIPERLLDL